MRNPRPRLRLAATLFVVAACAAAPGTPRADPACTCRYAGQSYGLDACVCIVTSAGARLACCDLVLNNTSWTFKGAICPMARTPAGAPPLRT